MNWVSRLFISRTTLPTSPLRSGCRTVCRGSRCFLWSLSKLSKGRTFLSIFRPHSAPQPTYAANGLRNAFPGRLLFYYAGKRTVYLGTLKLYTVILFSYCSIFVAPSIYPEHGVPLTICVLLGSLVPLLLLQTLSPPYITHAYIHLPPWAQYSKETLHSYLRNLPGEATVQLATIRWFGRPKITTTKLSDLRLERRRFGCVNIVRSLPNGKQRGYFYLDPRGSPAKVADSHAFLEIFKAVQRFNVEPRIHHSTSKK